MAIRQQFTEQPLEGEFEQSIIEINRCAKVHKGGRRFSFSALVVVGNRKGQVSYGHGKANEVPPAVEKAVKNAYKSMRPVALAGDTLPYRVIGKFGACKVILLPAGKGTGIIAAKIVRTTLELAGVRNALTKSFGSNTPVNLVKAVFQGLGQLKTKEEVERLRGVTVG